MPPFAGLDGTGFMPGVRSERGAPASAGGARAPGRSGAVAARPRTAANAAPRPRGGPGFVQRRLESTRSRWRGGRKCGRSTCAQVLGFLPWLRDLKIRRLRAQHRSSSRRALICACRRRWSSTLYLSGPRRPPGRAARRSGFEPQPEPRPEEGYRGLQNRTAVPVNRQTVPRWVVSSVCPPARGTPCSALDETSLRAGRDRVGHSLGGLGSSVARSLGSSVLGSSVVR